MMAPLIVLTVLVGAALAAPQFAYQPVPAPVLKQQVYAKPILILKQSQDDNYDGSFAYDFESENGIQAEGKGFLKNAGTKEEIQVIQGTYSYIAPDGTPISTRWYADETGFHAEGAHLPVAPEAPPLPPAIARALAYQASLPPIPEYQN